MPLSVGGGQLPLSAFFGSSGSSGKRSTKPRVASKRKDSPVNARGAEPPHKKRKQKENLTPSRNETLEDAAHQNSSKARGRRSSTSEMEIGEVVSVELADGVRANIGAGDAVIDLTADSDQNVIANSPSRNPHNLETPPLTPEAQDRHRDFDSTTWLPSPPLTAPDAKKVRKKCDEADRQENVLELPQVTFPDRGVRLRPVDTKNIDQDTVPSCGTPSQTHTVEHNVLWSSRASRRSVDLMPPPPLPLKALPPSNSPSATDPMPRPAQFNRSRSVSSEKWVPSSQTQELSIPRYEDMQDGRSSDEAPLAFRGRASQVVPSSQLSERELKVVHGTSDHRDARGPSRGPSVLVEGLGEPASSSAVSAPAVADGDPEESMIHEVIESSQSQFETEITAAWAETLATRREALRWPRRTSSSLPSSSPLCAVESQDYDAQSEWSSSIDEVSQSVTMDPRTSPLQPPSQLPSAESSGSFGDGDSSSYSVLPSQLRRFLETFEGRDEDGNELPRDAGVGPAQSSPTQDRGRSPCRRQSSQTVHDGITTSPPAIPQEYVSDGGSSYGSSFPSTMPTPLRNFLEMFSDTQTQDQLEVEPSQRRGDYGYDF